MSRSPSTSSPAVDDRILWPPDVQRRYRISAPTRWRWERAGKLPARDVFVGTRSGWRASTLEGAERGPASADTAAPAVGP
jgi:hypothetical protein